MSLKLLWELMLKQEELRVKLEDLHQAIEDHHQAVEDHHQAKADHHRECDQEDHQAKAAHLQVWDQAVHQVAHQAKEDLLQACKTEDLHQAWWKVAHHQADNQDLHRVEVTHWAASDHE